jgi:hypothetical protein
MATVKDQIEQTADPNVSIEVRAKIIAEILLTAGVTEPVPDALEKSLKLALSVQDSISGKKQIQIADSFPRAHGTKAQTFLNTIYEIVSARTENWLTEEETDLTAALNLVASSPLFSNEVKSTNKYRVMADKIKEWKKEIREAKASDVSNPSEIEEKDLATV